MVFLVHSTDERSARAILQTGALAHEAPELKHQGHDTLVLGLFCNIVDARLLRTWGRQPLHVNLWGPVVFVIDPASLPTAVRAALFRCNGCSHSERALMRTTLDSRATAQRMADRVKAASDDAWTLSHEVVVWDDVPTSAVALVACTRKAAAARLMRLFPRVAHVDRHTTTLSDIVALSASGPDARAPRARAP